MTLVLGEESQQTSEPGQTELLIKEARRKARRRRLVIALICVAVVAGGVIASAGGNGSPPTLHSLLQQLLSRSDYPTGWINTRSARQFEGGSLCGLDSKKQLLGNDAVQIVFRNRAAGSFSFEYLAYRRATVDAFERAITPVLTFASCGDSANGRVVDSSVAEGTILTPNFGDWSTANLVTNTRRGKRYQLGYMFVRKSRFVMVIGYENRGALDLKELENLTRKAVSKVSRP